MKGHEVYQLEDGGYACRRCSMWARSLQLFEIFSCCPPTDGR